MIQDLQKTIREEKLDKEHTRGLLPTKTELKRIMFLRRFTTFTLKSSEARGISCVHPY